MNRNFVSGFGTHLDNMIDLKMSMGFTESTYIEHARNFDRFCEQKHPDCTELTEALSMEWLQAVMGKSIHAVHSRLSFLRGFATYLIRTGHKAFSFPARFTSGMTVFVPYLFSDNELTALFHAIDSYECPGNKFHPILLSTYFRLTYTCGLRPKEGRVLKKCDVDLNTGEVRIEDSKNRRSRTIVMSDDMCALANAYAVVLNAIYPNSEYFFPSRKEIPYTEASMQSKFKKFFALANPDVPEEFLPQVRVYDLRHRFATAALNLWLDQKLDVHARLPYLQIYMGHKDIASTTYYIHLLPENLTKSAGIDWESLNQVFPGTDLWAK